MDTSHARSRRAALFGLILQVLATVAAVALATGMKSVGLSALFWVALGGVPIWLISLLVFRQRELAALEALDLAELRREKGAASDELFSDQSGGPGFAVARSRLEWMERYLLPVFSLITAVYLVGVGLWRFVATQRLISELAQNPLPPLEHAQIGMVVLSILTLVLFFCCRYASGMARVREWQLLRAGGSYMFATTLAALALVLCFGSQLYQGESAPERYAGLVMFGLMVALGLEMLLNFLLDVYRPRSPGTEPRAALDSRLMGLISEPTGIARSLAEAVNYQFGFQVSQTWFYQLLQRTLLPLVVTGVAALWLLTCFVVVNPHEHMIIERWGRQLDPEHPLGPGVHFKLPYPADRAVKFPTGQVRQFSVGYLVGDQPIRPKPKPEEKDPKPELEQWTDEKHSGQDHFNFIICPTPGAADAETASQPTTSPAGDRTSRRVALHLIRAEVFVQYRIDAGRLAEYTQYTSRPDDILRNAAWEEVTRVMSRAHVDALMGPLRQQLGSELRDRLARRCDEMKLGLTVVDVGLLNVHPEKSVATAFRGVVTAQQERVAEIRRARVQEEEVLTRSAGDTRRALAVARAIDHHGKAELRRTESEHVLRGIESRVPASAVTRLEALAPQFLARLQAEWELESALDLRDRVRQEFDLSMGRTMANVQQADADYQAAVAKLDEASKALEAAVEPIRAELKRSLDDAQAQAVIDGAAARLAVKASVADLEKNVVGIQGEAAVTLAKAQAQRWQRETQAAAQVARVQNERYAYQAAPDVYKARRYLQALIAGMQSARKYFIALEPGDRKVNIWLDAQEQARPDISNLPTSKTEP